MTWKCDGCGVALSEEEESRERCFTVRTPFSSSEVDICRSCWDRMLGAVGKTWDLSEHKMAAREGGS